MGQFIPIAIALAGTAAQQAETQRVERKTDQETAQSLLNQSKRQQDADRRVNEEISQLESSTAADERTQRLDQYRQQLQRGRQQAVGGLETPIGGATFQSDAGAARTGVDNAAAATAGLMARIDAPQLQRQGEAFGYGRLATDIDSASRDSRQQQFLDQLRLRAIRRRPEMDLLAGGLTAAGGAMGGAAGGMASAAPRQGASFYGAYDPITMGYA
ncbi:hypothetical protein [Stenotrophomonas rhizophila]|uniref:hypothetical protein n=1 Tax=Stenotrophomonas rhizophila TaxID=216778 RepID=UPI00112F6E2C|nr:hypothetical protein [Stenotrophomonas rhizophila]